MSNKTVLLLVLMQPLFVALVCMVVLVSPLLLVGAIFHMLLGKPKKAKPNIVDLAALGKKSFLKQSFSNPIPK
jgi:hypothetical protein